MTNLHRPLPQSTLALVHDWIFGLRGGERCLQAFLCLYEQADVFALFHQAGASHSEIDKRLKGTSTLNRLPKVWSWYRALLPLFPWASSISALQRYEVRISLSHAASKNITGSSGHARHICYCFTPMRYIWDQAGRYLGWKAMFFLPLILWLRRWDRQGAKTVHDFIAISRFVAARIRRYYGRRSTVIFPPVASDWLAPDRVSRPQGVERGEAAYLFAGALVPYKGAELAVKACTELRRTLWIAGDGPERKKLERYAGPNVKFLGKVSDAELAYLFNSCRALIFPCKEDFGILPLEVQAAGKPVIALHDGACKETIRGAKPWEGACQLVADTLAEKSYTGVFIKRARRGQNQLGALKESIEFFEVLEGQISSASCREQAAKFSPARFYEAWSIFAHACPILRDIPLVEQREFVARFEALRAQTS